MIKFFAIVTLFASLVSTNAQAQENESEVAREIEFNHNGSGVYMTLTPAPGLKLGTQLMQIIYDSPREGLAAIGVTPGTILFDGVVTGEGRVQGKAFIFNQKCGAFPYDVSGEFSEISFTLRGASPIVDASTCTVTKYSKTSGNATLDFTGFE